MKKLVPICVCLLLVISTHAAVITADDDGPAHYSHIQDAINSADDGDIIIVQPGLYEGDIKFLGKNITLTSTSPANPNVISTTIIQGDVIFRGTEDPNCTLAGFKINARIIGFDSSVDPNGTNHARATISLCVLAGNGVLHGTAISGCDGIISNCLVADNYSICYCLRPVIDGCNGVFKNCTIARNNSGIGICEGGITDIENCIIYYNWEQKPQISVNKGGTLSISYSDLQFGIEEIYLEDSNSLVTWGLGNIDEYPSFVRLGSLEMVDSNLVFHPGDYHLRSTAGRWDPSTNEWVTDVNTSICIDAGNPGCSVGSEPLPNGNRINMGAYGGTPTASKSPVNWHNIADITNDDIVNSYDLAALTDFWLASSLEQPADMNRNGVVDFVDFALMADNWLYQK